MKKKFIISIFLIVILLLSVTIISKLISNNNLDNRPKAASNSILNIKSCKQLFLNDNYLVESNNGFRITQNQPQKKGVVINNDKPWENEGFLGGYVAEFNKIDGSKYSLWTIARFNRGETESAWRGVEVFTSNDAVNWTRPDINKFDFSGIIKNNLTALGNSGTGKVPNGSTVQPELGSGLMSFGGPNNAKQVFATQDGINFTAITSPKVFDYYIDGTNQVFWDQKSQRYTLYFRSWAPSLQKFSTPKRDFGRGEVTWTWSSGEFLNDEWPNDLPSWNKFKGYAYPLNTDELDHPFYPWNNYQDIYSSNIFPYTAADCEGEQTIYLAMANIFNINTDAGDTYLAISRDNKNWSWVNQDQAYIPLSQDGSYDSLHNVSVLGLIERNNSLLQYYTGGDKGHDQAWANSKMFVTEQRLDGFISLDADNSQSELITKPFTFVGNTLTINSKSTNPTGKMNIELLDEDNHPITNFTLNDSLSITSDSISNIAYWTKGADLSTLVGKSIKLHIVANNSKVYGFQTSNTNLEENKISSSSTQSSCSNSSVNNSCRIQFYSNETGLSCFKVFSLDDCKLFNNRTDDMRYIVFGGNSKISTTSCQTMESFITAGNIEEGKEYCANAANSEYALQQIDINFKIKYSIDKDGIVTNDKCASGGISAGGVCNEINLKCNKYDLNSDGKINIFDDFTIFLNNSVHNILNSDFNNDQVVDIKDFLLFKKALYNYLDTKVCN